MSFKGLHKSMFNISLVGIFFCGGGCASGWGNVQNFFENVLLAGEMLKRERPTLTFPQWERFLGGLFASGWGNVKKFFENVLLAGEMLKSEKTNF